MRRGHGHTRDPGQTPRKPNISNVSVFQNSPALRDCGRCGRPGAGCPTSACPALFHSGASPAPRSPSFRVLRLSARSPKFKPSIDDGARGRRARADAEYQSMMRLGRVRISKCAARLNYVGLGHTSGVPPSLTRLGAACTCRKYLLMKSRSGDNAVYTPLGLGMAGPTLYSKPETIAK